MPAQGKGHRSRKLLAVTVLAALVLLSAANFRVLKTPLSQLARREIGFEDFADAVQAGYLSDSFAAKSAFVDLNGLFAGLTGQRTLNGVVKLNNGMLSVSASEMNPAALANGVAGFSNYLREQNIPFLYVQVPYKESLAGQDYPVGITSSANKNADNLLSQLSAAGVETLDLRPLLSQTPEMLEQYFYKTDHHWNSDGAFVAFQEILNRLHELLPDDNIDLTYAQADQWERHVINDWFLGSWGKRTGIFYAGTDPLIWYTPKFETELSCAVPLHGWLFRGDFTDANLRTQYIEKKDYYHSSAYCVYIGGDYPLVQHRNLNAPSPLKVMMLKDSFALPVQAYLSTVFQELDVVDPRYFAECTVAEYVELTKPDIVILSMNPNLFGNKTYRNLGVEDAVSISTEEGAYESVVQQDMEIEARDGGNYNFTTYPLEANSVYRVAFEAVDILEGQTEGVGLRLYDQTTNTVLKSAIFDLAYCEAANGFTWTFRTPDTKDELLLLFYAGIYGSTAENGIIYRNVTIEKMCDRDP